MIKQTKPATATIVQAYVSVDEQQKAIRQAILQLLNNHSNTKSNFFLLLYSYILTSLLSSLLPESRPLVPQLRSSMRQKANMMRLCRQVGAYAKQCMVDVSSSCALFRLKSTGILREFFLYNIQINRVVKVNLKYLFQNKKFLMVNF